jgi:hypothetical protein
LLLLCAGGSPAAFCDFLASVRRSIYCLWLHWHKPFLREFVL